MCSAAVWFVLKVLEHLATTGVVCRAGGSATARDRARVRIQAIL